MEWNRDVILLVQCVAIVMPVQSYATIRGDGRVAMFVLPITKTDNVFRTFAFGGLEMAIHLGE